MTLTRRLVLAGIAGIAGAAGLIAARSPSAQTAQPPVNVLAGARLAIHGYDPVAYFTDGGPRRGRPDLTAEHAGAVWRFASDANRQRFLEAPERYTPVYGGYCAYGVSQGYLVKIDPDAWSIVNGRLYLNYDKSVRTTWLKDVDGYVKKADTNWPGLVTKP